MNTWTPFGEIPFDPVAEKLVEGDPLTSAERIGLLALVAADRGSPGLATPEAHDREGVVVSSCQRHHPDPGDAA
jgi:hypothetical protein